MRLRLFLSTLFLLSGCLNADPTLGGGGANGGGANGSGAGGGGGDTVNNGAGGMGVPSCGKMTFPIMTNKTSPNVMMVVDESGSMREMVPGTNLSKWDSLKSAVHALLAKYDGSVNWGLSIFPHPGAQSCTPGQIDIPAGAGTSSQILGQIDALDNNTIGGNTPTEQTLAAVAQPGGGLNDPMHNNYVLLMTDGLPNCGSDGSAVALQVGTMYAAAPSVRTFVVGIGADTQSNPQTLDSWAVAGHTARMTSPSYYQANNITDLTTAFADILSGIASCTYQLASKPTDPSLLVAYLDGTAVATDPANGTTYDAGSSSIIFHGTSCDKIKSGAATKVDVIYGCPSPAIQ